jgi:translation initiation factor 2 beta subunit (eIF-2beta)/eIF-5
VDTQDLQDNFDGAKLLGAIALAESLISRGIVDSAKGATDQNPDRYPTDKETRLKLEDAFEKRAQVNDPSFTNENQLRRGKISPGAPGHPGSMQRFTKDNIPDLKSDVMYRMRYDPNVDRSIYAHELGHALSQNTEGGLAINRLAHELNKNPKLQDFLDTQLKAMPEGLAPVLRPYMKSPQVLAAGRLALPAAIAAAIPGDNDAVATVAASLALASPQLIDEFSATRNGLGIMKDAGMPATPRQKMRLAGAWGTYLAKPLTAALIGNVGGNVAEDVLT